MHKLLHCAIVEPSDIELFHLVKTVSQIQKEELIRVKVPSFVSCCVSQPQLPTASSCCAADMFTKFGTIFRLEQNRQRWGGGQF